MSDSQSRGQDMPSTFSQLAIMLATSALQQLGQIPDPSGESAPVSLEGAQGMIDLLEMLEVKTQGNLDEAESKILKESLTMLRLQYVEVKQAKGASAPAPEPAPAQPDSTPPPASDPTEPPPAPAEESKTKFRKSYG